MSTTRPELAWLRLRLQGSPWTSSLLTPVVSVNGYRVPASYGENLIPVFAGPTQVEVSCRWLRDYGEASLETRLAPGQHADVWYAAPLHQFAPGAIGAVRQQRPGRLGVLVALLLVAALVAAAILLPHL